jgi:hypothetical protein
MNDGLPKWQGSASDSAGLFSPSDWEYGDLLRDFLSNGRTFDIEFARRNPKALNAVSDVGLRYALSAYLDACLLGDYVLPDLVESVVFHLSPTDPDGQFWSHRKELLTSYDIRLMLEKLELLSSSLSVSVDAGLRRDLERAFVLWRTVLEQRTNSSAPPP